MKRWSRYPIVLIVLLASLFGPPAQQEARAEPLLVTITVTLLGGLVVSIVYDQATANYLSMAFGYATPQPDANLEWKLGRSNPAIAGDLDSYLIGGKPFTSYGQAYTEVGYLSDTLDPIFLSEGHYYNASRTWKNGAMKASETGGVPPPGQVTKINVDMSNLPLENNFTIDMHTGKLGSYDALLGGGARYVNGTWMSWRPQSETDPTLRDYLSGAMSPDSGSEIPSYAVPSVDELFSADASSGARDWFDYFYQKVGTVGTYIGSDGETYYNPFSFSVPISTPFSPFEQWYVSAEALAQSVPEPPTLALVFSGLLALGLTRLRWGR